MSLPLAHILNATVTYKEPTAISTGGDLSYGAAALTVAARVEHTDEIVLTEQGNEERAEYIVATETEIPKGSRVWVPGDDDTDVSAARRRLFAQGAPTPGGAWLYETTLSASGEG